MKVPGFVVAVVTKAITLRIPVPGILSVMEILQQLTENQATIALERGQITHVAAKRDFAIKFPAIGFRRADAGRRLQVIRTCCG